MNIPVGYCQVALKFTGVWAPFPGFMTFGVDGSAANSEDLLDMVQLWAEATNTKKMWSSDATLSSIRLKYGPNETGPSFERAVSVTGTAGNTTAPPQVAFLITKTSSSLGGRKNRGRMYQPAPYSAAVLDGGAVESTWLASGQSAYNALLSDLTTLGQPMVILHTSSSDPTIVDNLTFQSRVGTQRRRNRR